MMKKMILAGLLILLFKSVAMADVGSLTAIPGYNKIILSWVNDDGGTITLTRRVGSYPATITDGVIHTGTGTSYIDRNLTNGLTYYYTAFDTIGSFSSAFTTPKQDTSPPAAPGTITEGAPDEDFNDTGGGYTIYWESANDEQSDIKEYAVQERVGTSGSWGTIGTTPHLYFGVSGKISGKVYYYRVSAKNEAGLWGTWSITSDGIRVVDEKVELPNYGNYIHYTNNSGDMVIIDIPGSAFVGSVTFTISEISPPIDFASSTPLINEAISPCYEFLVFGTDSHEVQPLAPLTLSFSYNPHPLGTDTDYRIYRLGEGDNLWEALDSWTLISEYDLIMLTVGSLSSYVVGWPVISLAPIGSFTATAGNNREITLTWNSFLFEGSRTTEVIIVRNTGTYADTIGEGTQIYRGTLTTYTDIWLTPGTTCYYTAFASDGGANYSAPVFAQAVATDTTPPGLVGSFTVKGEFKKIILSWNNPGDADFVKTVIVRSLTCFPQNLDEGRQIYQNAGTSTTDTDVIVGEIYYYTAFSYDGINYSLATISVQGSATPTSDDTPPTAPGTVTEGLLDEDFNSTGGYTLYWGAATDNESPITQYFVQERVGTDGTWGTIGYTSQLYGNISGKSVGKVYYYRVQAQNEAGLWGTWSMVSDGIRVVHKAVQLPAVGSIVYNQMKVDVPGNAFVGSVTFTISQISAPVNFASSTPPMSQFLSPCYELLAFDSKTMQEVQPTKTLTMFFTYSPLTAGTESDYRIYQFGGELWELVAGSQTVFQQENLIRVEIGSLSTYVVGYPKGTLTDVSSFTATPGNNREITLTWVFPQDERVTEVIIVKNMGTYATNIGSGTQIFRGTRTQTMATYTETSGNLGTVCYYSAFSSDGGINYSAGTFTQAIATDTTPPGLVGSFTVKSEFKKVALSWTNPDDTDFVGVKIIRHFYHFPQTPEDGSQIYEGMGTATQDEKFPSYDQTRYYTAFSYDGINYSLATITVQGSATLTKDTSPPSTIGTITEGYWGSDVDRDVSIAGNYYWVNWSVGSDTESGITGYALQEKKNGETWGTVSDDIRDTHYLITGKAIGNIYYYRVRAKNGTNIWGSWSTTSDGIRVVSMYFNLPQSIGFSTGTEKIEIVVPGNAFEGTTTLTMTNVSLSPATYFVQATPKIKKTISLNWQLTAINRDNIEQIPTTTLTLFITYSDTGLSAEDEAKLRIYQLNKVTNQLEAIPGTLLVDDNIIYATITTLSTFIVALPSSPAVTPMGVKVYPNPFKPSQGHDKITFEGLTNEVKIRIYKITGELVYEKEYSSTNGYEYWQAINSYGEELASGAYIYVIEGGGEKAIGKIAIIR